MISVSILIKIINSIVKRGADSKHINLGGIMALGGSIRGAKGKPPDLTKPQCAHQLWVGNTDLVGSGRIITMYSVEKLDVAATACLGIINASTATTGRWEWRTLLTHSELSCLPSLFTTHSTIQLFTCHSHNKFSPSTYYMFSCMLSTGSIFKHIKQDSYITI